MTLKVEVQLVFLHVHLVKGKRDGGVRAVQEICNRIVQGGQRDLHLKLDVQQIDTVHTVQRMQTLFISTETENVFFYYI